MNINVKESRREVEVKVTPIIEVNGVEIECPNDMYELVETLIDAGPGTFFAPVIIYDIEFRDKLEAAGLIINSASGKSGKSGATEELCENGEEILKKIEEAFSEV